MRMFIPELGTQLELKDDWTFSLQWEYRNYKFWTAMGFPEIKWEDPWTERLSSKQKAALAKLTEELSHKNITVSERKGDRYGSTQLFHGSVTVPKGAQLTVDRIYIRKGAEDFSSVSFYVTHSSFGNKKFRFWAKLDDVNTMNVATVTEKVVKPPKPNRYWYILREKTKVNKHDHAFMNEYHYYYVGMVSMLERNDDLAKTRLKKVVKEYEQYLSDKYLSDTRAYEHVSYHLGIVCKPTRPTNYELNYYYNMSTAKPLHDLGEITLGEITV